MTTDPKDTDSEKRDFIRDIINEDNRTGKHDGRVHTRFPPEPNGYLHIGHAKSICINFGIAEQYGGLCNMRFDDTNPAKEDVEYVDSILEDVRWLGFDWEDRLYHASDYFEELYGFAVQLIEQGKAYVCSLSQEEIRQYRGTLTEAGKDSPDRDRSVQQNLDLFERMKAGEFEDGEYVLRAKIDMSSPNITLRDPAIYRIKKTDHHRTGDSWCIYPMYDYTHCLSDMLEEITHSICTLEFENHRPLYDWVLDTLGTPCHPQQIEFARLNLTYMVMSKRKLLQLVDQGHVSGWDDPRMPTICGLRRRGYTPESIRAFCDKIGVAKRDGVIEISQLEHCLREHLNEIAPRVMAVLDPLKVVITNYPQGQTEQLVFPWHPTDQSMGSREVPFSREIYLERGDFMEDPPRKFYRLAPGREVRLRYAYYITCQEVIKNDDGEVIELRCTYDPATKGGDSPDGRKVKATLHWVSAEHALDCEVRLCDHLFNRPDPGSDGDFLEDLNPDSMQVITAQVEPSVVGAEPGTHYQFERKGYFCVDRDGAPDQPVFNRTVGLRDSWARLQKQQQQQQQQKPKQNKQKRRRREASS